MATNRNIRDLVVSPLGFTLNWGLPILAMLAVIWAPHPVKTWVWVAALLWMGGACLWNAQRCGRKHCYWTGPFFLIMALPVLAHGYQFMSLGTEGWKLLGLTTGVGAAAITVLTERSGKYT